MFVLLVLFHFVTTIFKLIVFKFYDFVFSLYHFYYFYQIWQNGISSLAKFQIIIWNFANSELQKIDFHAF